MSEITFNGVTASSKGVKVLEYPDIAKPNMRTETVKVPGRHGELTLVGLPSYDARVMEVGCSISDPTKISAAAAWLTGRGDLVLGNDSNYAYDARVVDEFSFQKILRGHLHRRFTVPFLVQPLKKAATAESAIQLTVSGGSVTNPGHVTSRPEIKVEGSGDITLMIGTQTITLITGMTAPVLIDSDGGIATNLLKTQNASYLISGDWPMIPTGSSTVSWTGNVTKVTITPRWRWL